MKQKDNSHGPSAKYLYSIQTNRPNTQLQLQLLDSDTFIEFSMVTLDRNWGSGFSVTERDIVQPKSYDI